jgi:serine/threonine protein kinase
MTHDDQRIDALPHGSVLNAYLVERVLGSGAFGITYLVKHRHLASWHVIKEYLPDCGVRENNRSTVSPKSGGDKDLFDWGLKSFFDEAKLLYQLSHPHVVKVTDLFDANGTAYFVMPFLQGVTLHEWMKNNPRPSQTDLEAIFVPLLEGLKYIHDKGLLHRDIKPENIFIVGNGHPVLIDFGSARMAIGQKSKVLTQVLTPHFAPFEQYASKGTFAPALDLYSLAACLYQAITGQLPEEAPNRLIEDEQPKLVGSAYEKRYTEHFLQAIDKSLSVHARDRHQDGFELQKDLVGSSHVTSIVPEVPEQLLSKPDQSTTQPPATPPLSRFMDNGDGTVTDTQTGLMWTKNANPIGRLNWNNAMRTVANFKISGFFDWQLPSKDELVVLSNAMKDGHPFTGVQSSYYWSSTSYELVGWARRSLAVSSDYAWYVGIDNGYVETDSKNYFYHVWPVCKKQ